MSWQSLSPTEREREYSPSSCIGGNYQPFIAAYASESVAATAKTTARGAAWAQHHYGQQVSQTLRLCVPKQGIEKTTPLPLPLPPLLVFIHGGYWQELSAADSLFAATGCVMHGAAFAAIDYTLAPHASVAQMVDECRQALAYLSLNATSLGFDQQRIVVTGSSAGAHLAAMVAQQQQDYSLCGAVLVSGIYELEPLIGTTINQALGLTIKDAHAISPALLTAQDYPPTVVCYGEIETTEFKRQSTQFAQQLREQSAANHNVKAFEVPLRNHFDVIMDLTDARTALGQATLKLLQITTPETPCHDTAHKPRN